MVVHPEGGRDLQIKESRSVHDPQLLGQGRWRPAPQWWFDAGSARHVLLLGSYHRVMRFLINKIRTCPPNMFADLSAAYKNDRAMDDHNNHACEQGWNHRRPDTRTREVHFSFDGLFTASTKR